VQPGADVDATVVDILRETLAAYSGKSVTMRGPTTLDVSTSVHSADEVRALADRRGRFQGNGTGVVHVLYLKGAFSDESALGVTVRADTTAVFPDQIARVASPF